MTDPTKGARSRTMETSPAVNAVARAMNKNPLAAQDFQGVP
jgi:hypothetical protein